MKNWPCSFVLMIVAILLVGCAGTPTPTPEPTTIPLSGRVTFAGSTSLQPLVAKQGEAFRALYPDVVLEIAAGGSVVGIQAAHDGTVDIGMASRGLSAEEAAGLNLHQVAVDVIAVVVHEDNPVETLTLEQLQGIYLGEIENWSQVGGHDQSIIVVTREENSGTRGAFDSIALHKQAPAAPLLKTAITAGDAAATVKGDAGAIGYVGFGNLEEGIKLLAINGVLPSSETVRDGSYPLARPLYLLTGSLSQPLAQAFIDFALGEAGQAIVRDEGWVAIH